MNVRLLFVSNLYPPIYLGGYEQACFDVAQRLKARGHEVHVLTSSYKRDEVQQEEDNVYRQLRLKRGWPWPSPSLTWRSALDSASVQWHNVRAMRRRIDRLRPDAVMIWNGNHLGYRALVAAEERARVVYYLSDLWLAAPLAWGRQSRRPSLGQHLHRSVFAAFGMPSGTLCANSLLFASRALQQEYVRVGVDAPLAEVIYHGISTEIFSPCPPRLLARREDEPHRILYSGQIAPEKGVNTLVDALRKLRRRPGLEGTELSVLGAFQSEAYATQLKGRIAEKGLDGAVHFLARRPRPELADAFAAHDVLAFTSELPEAFALTLLEAMSVGVPVVSTLCGGSAEVVRDGENGLAFRAGDSDDLAQKLAWVLNHPEEAAAMGRRASAEVAEKYSLDGQVRAVEAYLRSFVAAG